VDKPTKKYKIHFQPNDVIVEVDPARVPYGDTGNPGSILDIALSNGVDIEHVCGGNAACSTCHVKVKKGLATCNPISTEEQDQLDNATNRDETSRLSCQTVPNGSEDVEVEVVGP